MKVEFDENDLQDPERCIRLIEAIAATRAQSHEGEAVNEPLGLGEGLPREERQRILDSILALDFKNPIEHEMLERWRGLDPAARFTYEEWWEYNGRPDRRVFAAAQMHAGRVCKHPKYFNGQGLWLEPAPRRRVNGTLVSVFIPNPHIHPDAPEPPNLLAA